MPTFDDAQLNTLRSRVDPEADAAVAQLRKGREHLDARAFMMEVLALGRAPQGKRCDEVRSWFDTPPALPTWANDEASDQLVEHGQEFFKEWSLPITASLFCGSLPAAYAAAKGARVLGLTSDLAQHGKVNRRVAETGKMLIDVMELGAPGDEKAIGGARPLAFGTKGQQSIRGVRFLHGVIRHSLDRDPRWRDDACRPRTERPINQEDLLGTLLTFTSVVFHGMDQLGLAYDHEGADAYLHTWCVIGVHLGIDADLLPLDRKTADDLMWKIAARQQRPSDDGRVLTAALLQEMETSMPIGMRRVPRTLIRQLLPRDVADKIDVPKAAWWAPVLDTATRWNRVLTRIPGIDDVARTASEVIGKAMIRLYVDRNLDDGKTPFEVVDRVARHYGVETTPMRCAARKTRRDVRVRVVGIVETTSNVAGTVAAKLPGPLGKVVPLATGGPTNQPAFPCEGQVAS